MEPIFENIQQKIIQVLDNAKKEILISVPWFTDFILFQKILLALQKNIKVQIVIENDNINKNSKIDYNLITALKGEFFWHKSNTGHGILHDKFCIVDETTLIMGSYNWTYSAANFNKESIILTEDQSVILEYKNKFIKLTHSNECKKNTIPQGESSKYEILSDSKNIVSLVADSYKEQENKNIIPYKALEKGWKYRDRNGNDIFDLLFEEAEPFYFEVAKVKINGKWGLINKAGEYLSRPIYSEIGNFFLVNFYSVLDISKHPDIVWAKAIKEGKSGYLTIEGREIVPCLFENVEYEFLNYPDFKEVRILYKKFNFNEYNYEDINTIFNTYRNTSSSPKKYPGLMSDWDSITSQ